MTLAQLIKQQSILAEAGSLDEVDRLAHAASRPGNAAEYRRIAEIARKLHMGSDELVLEMEKMVRVP